MIKKYRDLGNISIGVMLISFAAIAITGQNSEAGNVWGEGGAPAFLMYSSVTSIGLAFAFYAKSKGHSAWYGLLAVLNIIGLAVLLKLEDRHPTPASEASVSNLQKMVFSIFILVGLSALAYVAHTIKGMQA